MCEEIQRLWDEMRNLNNNLNRNLNNMLANHPISPRAPPLLRPQRPPGGVRPHVPMEQGRARFVDGWDGNGTQIHSAAIDLSTGQRVAIKVVRDVREYTDHAETEASILRKVAIRERELRLEETRRNAEWGRGGVLPMLSDSRIVKLIDSFYYCKWCKRTRCHRECRAAGCAARDVGQHMCLVFEKLQCVRPPEAQGLQGLIPNCLYLEDALSRGWRLSITVSQGTPEFFIYEYEDEVGECLWVCYDAYTTSQMADHVLSDLMSTTAHRGD
ncbi:unnamed protein product [Vitrella brassicaformis CCMP3155]|uniref:Uncharacterized protein n=1 Tax=Vitrella brassicaformis (strain CCMP3155) TaxID=1169540 RepID=A0A0G4GDY1_VITBC|nr:unnamed protein product [Vitrella brassicaformis CCMP3155]|eukprot:CEM27634.1 unnamed protein product [Vitrella brassicaformis CCMP3155]